MQNVCYLHENSYYGYIDTIKTITMSIPFEQLFSRNLHENLNKTPQPAHFALPFLVRNLKYLLPISLNFVKVYSPFPL